MAHKKVEYVLVDTSKHLPQKGTLANALHKVCPRILMIEAKHFDSAGNLHPQALQAAAENMSRGGDVCVDLPDRVRLNADAFNAFARSVIACTDAQAPQEQPVPKGQMFFTQPAYTLTATKK